MGMVYLILGGIKYINNIMQKYNFENSRSG
jgi:hypothetical protein